MLKFKNKKGFSLVELMIVVLILGIIASVAIPRLRSTRAESEKQACRGNLSTMQSVIEYLLFTTGIVIADGTNANDVPELVARYPQGITECPSGGTYTITGNKVECSLKVSDGHNIAGT